MATETRKALREVEFESSRHKQKDSAERQKNTERRRSGKLASLERKSPPFLQTPQKGWGTLRVEGEAKSDKDAIRENGVPGKNAGMRMGHTAGIGHGDTEGTEAKEVQV